MSGSKIVIDTSLIINLFNGSEEILPLITDRDLYVSVITEIEVLSFSKLTDLERLLFRDFLADCYIIELESPIRDLTVSIRSKHKIKLPDAVIAATAMYYDIPLLTMDKGFNKISGLNAVILNP